MAVYKTWINSENVLKYWWNEKADIQKQSIVSKQEMVITDHHLHRSLAQDGLLTNLKPRSYE